MNWLNWRLRIAVALLLLVALLGVTAGIYLQRAKPQVRGSVVVEGLRAVLKVERDAQGIPTIRAASLDDAIFGLGFVHAQDRLWQMETHRRIGAGRLAEAFGEAVVEQDRFLRTLQVRRAAQAQWEAMSGESREQLRAYTAGVNAGLRQMRARPPEFLLLGLQPEPWEPVDSLAWTIMMAWDLGGNWQQELLRLRLSLRLPMARLNQLLPPYPGEQPLLTADYGERLRQWQLAGRVDDTLLDRLARAAPPSGVEGLGSNNWAVAGRRSETGAPLLANDPHLKLGAPSLWYLARLVAPGLEVAGATIPGLPMVVLGQNRDIAWGFTNTGPDVQDLYLERVNPADTAQYQTPEGWADFETRREIIQVRGGDPVPITVRRTRHGPVISDLDRVSAGLPTIEGHQPMHVLALRWTALEPDPGTLVAGLRFQRASSVAEFLEASRSHVAPMQNMLVADRHGRIAFVAAGRVPLRAADHDLKGLVPAPGWEPKYDWMGYLAADQTPRDIDPARGWLATANQRIHGPEYPHFISSEWAAPWRQDRIEALLKSRAKHSVDSLAAMQHDTLSRATLKLLPSLLRAASEHPLADAAQRELAAFDGDMRPDRAAPLIFWAWVRQITRGIFADEVGASLLDRSFTGRSFRDALEGVLERNDGWWCDDKATPQVAETCAQQSQAALTRALEELSGRLGPDVARWRWGEVHQARFEHKPFSQVGSLAGLFELRAPVGGDTFSVNVSRVALQPDPRTGELYLDEHGPSLRAVYDLADPARSRIINATGQSGLPFSGHYRDLLGPWARGEQLPLWPANDAPGVELELRPSR